VDEEVNVVVVDTYAIMADLTGQATPFATKVLDSIRVGEVKGVVHYLIVYELAYHWRKGRLPFRDEKELVEFIDTYFDLVDLSPEIATRAAQVKIRGDELLKQAKRIELRRRKLAVSDATTIVLALDLKAPIVTGDIDLSYVAKRLGVRVIW